MSRLRTSRMFISMARSISILQKLAESPPAFFYRRIFRFSSKFPIHDTIWKISSVCVAIEPGTSRTQSSVILGWILSFRIARSYMSKDIRIWTFDLARCNSRSIFCNIYVTTAKGSEENVWEHLHHLFKSILKPHTRIYEYRCYID